MIEYPAAIIFSAFRCFAPSSASRPESSPESVFGSSRYDFTTMLMEIHHANGRMAERLEAIQKTLDSQGDKLSGLEKKIDRYTHIGVGGFAVLITVLGLAWWAMGDIVSKAVRESLKTAISAPAAPPKQ